MAEDYSDLLGDSSGATDAGGGSSPSNGSMADAVTQGISQANPDQDREKEQALVKQTWEEYTTARTFDEHARKGFAKDRLYAAGKADPRWASDANLIGSFIDILVSFLYAKNPDFSCRPAKKVGAQPDADATAFAETAELVGSSLWLHGNLKKCAKKSVRSTLSVGQGWKKALMYTEKRPCPQVEKDILTQQSLLDTMHAQQSELGSQVSPPADAEAADEAIKLTLQGLQAKEAAAYSTGMCFDFIRAEDMQVSLDVASISDYLDADWCSNDLYILKSSAKARFSRLTDEDIKSAAVYYQRQSRGKDQSEATASQQGDSLGEGAFTKAAPSAASGKGVEFIKVVEMWRKCQGMVCTMIDGVKVWAADPYPPPQATARFYPYFLDALFEVDGERHPQSLVFRLFKLQDEYSACRSNQRLVRERSIPGTLFHAGLVSPEDAKRIANSTIQENIPVNLTDPTAPIGNAFAAKPVSAVNFELYNTAPITSDMERISGVQEALQSTSAGAQPKTATEAHIQQSGFASRTNADRDSIEDGYTDLAFYTVETAIQEMRPPQAQRIAGSQAFWPYGMEVQDILTLVEVNIEAGSTGKPDAARATQNWSLLLPMIEQLLSKIRVVELTDPPLAKAMTNLLRESLKRLDDRLNLDDFIPQEPPPPQPDPPPPPPQVKVNINLQGQLPPGDAHQVLEAEAGEQMAAHGGMPAGGPMPGPGGAPALPPGIASQVANTKLPGGVPMPPLSPKLDKGSLKAGPTQPESGTPKA